MRKRKHKAKMQIQFADVKKYLILYLPYLVIFYVVNKGCWLFRHCIGGSVISKIGVMLLHFEEAFTIPWPSINWIDLSIGILAGLSIKLLLLYKGKNAKKFRKGEEYGSARWGTEKDIAPFVDSVFENNVILTQTESLTMNSRPKNPKYARNKNVMVIGGSGSGKTRFYVKPNLMQMGEKISYVVTDPKGSARRSSLKRTGTSQLNNCLN